MSYATANGIHGDSWRQSLVAQELQVGTDYVADADRAEWLQHMAAPSIDLPDDRRYVQPARTIAKLAAQSDPTADAIEAALQSGNISDELLGTLHAAAVQRAELQRRLRFREALEAAESAEDVDQIVANHLHATPDEIIRTVTSADLAGGDYNRRWIVENALVANEPLVIAGAMKTLKTTVGIDLGISIATETKFLGRYQALEAANVGIVSGESGPATIQETARRIAFSKGLDLSQCDRLFWSFDLPDLSKQTHLTALSKFIKRNNLSVLILDPFYLCLGEGVDGTNLFSMGERLRRLADVAKEHDCLPAFVHHFKRGQQRQGGEPTLQDIAFAGAAEYCRQFILLDRRTPYSGEQPGHHELTMVVGGSAGHSLAVAVDIDEGRLSDAGGRKWDVEIKSLSEAAVGAVAAKVNTKLEFKEQKDTATLLGNRKKIVTKLTKIGAKGETESALAAKTGLNPATAKRVLDELLEEGVIEECEIQKKNRKTPYDGYRIKHVNTESDEDSLC